MENNPNHTSYKKILLVLAGLVAVVLVAVAVVVLIKTIAANNAVSNDKPSLSAQEIMAEFTGVNGIQALNEAVYTQQPGSESTALIYYKAEGRSYIVTTAAKDHALFYPKNKLEKDDTDTVQSQTAAFMDSRGFKKLDFAVTSPQYLTNVTYKNKTTVCQLTGSGITPSAPSYHAFACTANQTVEDEYVAVEKLLGLYKQAHQLTDFAQAIRVTETEDNKALSIISLGGKTHPALLFAAVDDNWSYIGDLGAGDKSNGKYSVSPEIKSAISDPKYGDFLTKKIGQ